MLLRIAVGCLGPGSILADEDLLRVPKRSSDASRVRTFVDSNSTGAAACFLSSSGVIPFRGPHLVHRRTCSPARPGTQTPRMGSGRRPRAPRARTREDSADKALADPWTPEKLGFVLVGTIVGAHGVRGEARVRADTDFPRERLGYGRHTRYLLRPGRRYPRPIGVIGGRPAAQSGHWLVRLAGVKMREDAEGLRGAEIYVRQDARPRMSREEFLVGELVGMRVRLVDGTQVGTVRAVLTRDEICAASGGGKAAAAVGSDLLEVEVCPTGNQAGTEGAPESTLVPFVKQFVPHVNRKERVVVLDPPEGLLEVARVNNKYVPPPPRGLLMAARDVK